jgi:NAD-dependent deacetylase
MEELLIEHLRGARAVLAFCGAGVSAESGLPTFRGAGGLWEGHRVEEVATPQAFRRDPALVWRFYAARQQAHLTVHPNPAHEALAAMEDRYDPFLLVTQNVDQLHERAGSRKMIKLHGSLFETRCTACAAVHTLADPIVIGEDGELPHCECGGLLRPNVVWFGELLDPACFRAIESFAEAAYGRPTLFLIIGTSGQVSGGYGLTQVARLLGATVIEINPNPSMLSGEADLAIRAPAGELLGRVWPDIRQEDLRTTL